MMTNKVTRRSLVAIVFGWLGGGLLTPTRSVAATSVNSPDTELDLCFWRRENGPICRTDGYRYEYWCYRCNDPGTGSNVLWCEWRKLGRC